MGWATAYGLARPLTRQALLPAAPALAAPCAWDPLAPSPPSGLCEHVPAPKPPPTPRSPRPHAPPWRLPPGPHSAPPAALSRSLCAAAGRQVLRRFRLDRMSWGSRSAAAGGALAGPPVRRVRHLCIQLCYRGCGRRKLSPLVLRPPRPSPGWGPPHAGISAATSLRRGCQGLTRVCPLGGKWQVATRETCTGLRPQGFELGTAHHAPQCPGARPVSPDTDGLVPPWRSPGSAKVGPRARAPRPRRALGSPGRF